VKVHTPPRMYQENTTKPERIRKKQEAFKIVFPGNFSIEKGLEDAIFYTNKVRDFKARHFSHLFLDLSKIKNIDLVCIVMLLSSVNQVASRRIPVFGNQPLDPICNDIFNKSGFLSHMNKISGGKFTSSDEHNLIVKIGTDKANPDLIGKTNLKAVKLLTGKEFHFKKINSMVGEMAGNTMEFAYSINKHYLYCYNYCGGDEITFVFSDVGYGIINTLNKSVGHIIKDSVTFKDKLAVLSGAFEKKYGSKTEEVNRNQGLPFIKSLSSEGSVKDLIVITNDVYLDFNSSDKSKVLSNKYSGTVYAWKVNKIILDNYSSI